VNLPTDLKHTLDICMVEDKKMPGDRMPHLACSTLSVVTNCVY